VIDQAAARCPRGRGLDELGAGVGLSVSGLPSKNGAGTQPSAGGADENYCCPGRNCTGARACALACVGGSVDTGLRVGVAIGGGGAADVLGRRFCSEASAIARAIYS
jgi:hypothetical protein